MLWCAGLLSKVFANRAQIRREMLVRHCQYSVQIMLPTILVIELKLDSYSSGLVRRRLWSLE